MWKNKAQNKISHNVEYQSEESLWRELTEEESEKSRGGLAPIDEFVPGKTVLELIFFKGASLKGDGLIASPPLWWYFTE